MNITTIRWRREAIHHGKNIAHLIHFFHSQITSLIVTIILLKKCSISIDFFNNLHQSDVNSISTLTLLNKIIAKSHKNPRKRQ